MFKFLKDWLMSVPSKEDVPVGKRLTNDDKKAIRKMHNDGKDMQEIADVIKRPYQTIYYFIQQHVETPKQRVIRLYFKLGQSPHKIAQKISMSVGNVYKIVAEERNERKKK